MPYMCEQFGNPHSRSHAYGWESEKAVEFARQVWCGGVGSFVLDRKFWWEVSASVEFCSKWPL